MRWRAGVASVTITPEQPMWMSGYAARTRPAEGRLGDLYAKALVLEDPAGTRVVLVTMDLVGIDRKLSREVCAELTKKFHLPRESILLSVSHTHSGPVVEGNLDTMYFLHAVQQKLVSDYARTLRTKLIGVVGTAMGQLAPARVEWGIGRCAIAVNRRNNKEADVPRLRKENKLKGPVDHDLPVLAVRDDAGTLKAIVCGYACHATTLDDYLWSGDYPGYGMAEIEKNHPGAIALFWAGCGADQNPIPRRQVSLAQAYGKQLAADTEAVLDKPMTPLAGPITAVYSEIELPFAKLPSPEEIARNSRSKNRYEASRAQHLLRRIQEKGPLSETYPYPIQVWRFGSELTWIALGGEVVVDYSLRLKKELEPGHTWVTAYANDVMAYIPSVRVLKEGGYEGGGAMVYYGLPSPWGEEVEGRIVAAVHGLVGRK